MKQHWFLVGLFGITSIVCLLISPGCANIVPPQGGPRDTIPPVLLKVTPGDSSTRFVSKKIDFYFDEYIDVQDPQTQLLVSPLPTTSPTVDARLRDLSVRLKDSLLPNTTYTIDFGNAIKDFTEGNIAKGIRYVFSTGNYIDSLEIYGKVILAETGKTDSTLIAMLHTDPEDSAVFKKKPTYIARLDKEGRFSFKNLPAQTFYLYALKDESGMRRYNDKKQLFAFAAKPVFSSLQKDSLTLYAYVADPGAATSLTMAPPETAAKKTDTDKRLKYQTSIQNNQQDILLPFQFQFENRIKQFDSSGIRLYKDSIYSPVDSFQLSLDTTGRQLTLTTLWEEGQSYHLILSKGAAEDSLGKQWTKTDTLSFTTKRKTDYGKLKIRLRGLDIGQQPVLQFVQSERVVKAIRLTGPLYEEALFYPGEYQIRILLDKNENGRWDTGSFFGDRRQPEQVIPLEKRITVKPNWLNEYELETGSR
jgi:hypothetical protein